MDDEALPGVAGMYHEIAFGRWHEQQWLRVCCYEPARSWSGRYDESHFVTDGNPVLSIDSSRAIGTRCAVGEMDGEYGSEYEKRV